MKDLSNLFYVDLPGREDYILDIKPINNWKSGIKDFYENKEDEKIEKESKDFANAIGGLMGSLDIQLRWDEELGLDGISFGTHPGIYLNEQENWQEHNMNTKSSILALAILTNYYHKLSKYVKP